MTKITVTPCILVEGIAIPVNVTVVMDAQIGGAQGMIYRLEIPDKYRES